MHLPQRTAKVKGAIGVSNPKKPACPPIYFSPVTRAEYEQIEIDMESITSGIDVSPEEAAADAGTVKFKGVEIGWEYRTPDTLAVWCIDKPFYAPCGVVNGKIRATFEDRIKSLRVTA